jgi:hypothetical protein
MSLTFVPYKDRKEHTFVLFVAYHLRSVFKTRLEM